MADGPFSSYVLKDLKLGSPPVPGMFPAVIFLFDQVGTDQEPQVVVAWFHEVPTRSGLILTLAEWKEVRIDSIRNAVCGVRIDGGVTPAVITILYAYPYDPNPVRPAAGVAVPRRPM